MLRARTARARRSRSKDFIFETPLGRAAKGLRLISLDLLCDRKANCTVVRIPRWNVAGEHLLTTFRPTVAEVTP
jgi:hypothetical protein